jgi:hypothetical protein
MKRFAAGFKSRGMKIAVLDPMRDPAWKCDYLTTDAEEFLRFAKTHTGYHLFSDESGSGIGKFNGVYDWLGTTSRHYGHQFWAGCHRLQQLSPTLRSQADQLFLFACGPKDAEALAEDWGVEALRNCKLFDRGRFIWAQHFAPPIAGQIDFARQRFTLGRVAENAKGKR